MTQQDLSPTLALLTGVPIPRNSLGRINLEVVSFLQGGLLDKQLELAALYYNAHQVAGVLKSNLGAEYKHSEFKARLLYVHSTSLRY